VELQEREELLAALLATFEDACKEDGRIAVIRGEAGIGKTSLARALTTTLADRAAVLWGNCDDLLTPQPMAPIWDLVDDLPAIVDPLQQRDVRQVFRVLLEFISRGAPTVIVLEDLHTADSATLDLVAMLGRRIDQAHGLLVVTLRDDAPPEHQVWSVLGELPSHLVEYVSPTPLSLEAVTIIAGPKRAERVWQITGGNPFLVSELAMSDGHEVPISIQDSIRARLSRRTSVAQQLIELVSVVPGGADLKLIETVDPSLTKAIEEVETSGLVSVDAGVISIRHELAREAIESLLSKSRSADLHSEVLDACETLGLDVALCAHHARLAGRVEAMLRLLPESARSALRSGSYAEAGEHLKAVRPYLRRLSPEDRAEILELGMQISLAVSGAGLDQAHAAIVIRRELGEPIALGRSLLLGSRVASYAGNHELASKRAIEASLLLHEEGSHDDRARAYAEESRLAMMENDLDRAVELGELALTYATPTSEARANALTNIGVSKAIWDYPAGVAELEESIRIGRAKGGLELEQYRATENLVSMAGSSYDFGRIEDLLRLAEIDDRPALVNSLRRTVFQTEIDRGRLASVNASAREMLANPATHDIEGLLLSMQVAEASVKLGLPDSEHWVPSSWTLARESGLVQFQSTAAQSLVLLHWYRGVDSRIGEADLDDALDVLDRHVGVGGPWQGSHLALYLWFVGKIDEVPPKFAEPVLGMTEGRWQQSAAWFGERGVPFSQGLALSLGDVDARKRAVQVFSEIGARPHATLVRNALRSEGISGIPAIARRPRSELGLTARQHDVLDLLAKDLTNNEIGRRLFISSRTVEKHVAAVIDKLDVADRKGAAAVARAQPGPADLGERPPGKTGRSYP
jgi:DNA-binding CsgD family transcriptional regulator